MNRRIFISQNVLTIGFSGWMTSMAMDSEKSEADVGVKFGLFTDMHHADKPHAGTRYYRETLSKFAEAQDKLRHESLDFVVELGDLIDAADSVEKELTYLKRINREYEKLAANRYYVLGNHCVDTLTKEEFLGEVGQAKSYFSFNQSDWHFIILDACFRNDGVAYQRKNFQWTDPNIPQHELDWLQADLKANPRNTIVFAHQRLDDSGNHMVRNASKVRQILESSGHVKAVFQGHSHKNAVQMIGEIPYVTFEAMIEGSGPENNAYSLVNARPDGSIQVSGFRHQANRSL